MLRNSRYRAAVLSRAYVTDPPVVRGDPAKTGGISSAAGAEPLEELGGEILSALARLGGGGAQRAQSLAGPVAERVCERDGENQRDDDGDGNDRCERHAAQTLAHLDGAAGVLRRTGGGRGRRAHRHGDLLVLPARLL